MQQDSQNGKIRPYRKPLNINLGMFVFGIIFVYVLICVAMYFLNDKHIEWYTVQNGSLSQNNVYTGLALREENVVYSSYSGYINYYAREGERMGSGQLVCTVDESGQLREILSEENADNTAISDSSLMELRAGISNFCSTFQPSDFADVYDFKYELEGTVLQLANVNVLENLSAINAATNGQTVGLCRTDRSGIVVYSVDGYEDKTADSITAADLSQENYQKQQLLTNDLVAANDPLYKLSTSENWSILIAVDRQTAEQLEEEEVVKVRFLKNQYESWANVTILDKGEEDLFAKLDFTNSMVTFVTDRFISLELLTDTENGLKVPVSSITNKEFFLVPKDFVSKGGNSGENGVLRQVAGENGELTTEFIATQIYEETEDDYYLDNYTLRVGDHLIKPDSDEEYTVSRSASLVGVYNINKGYADFKEVEILQENEEYAIIRSNTTYGLSVYDHIVLDAKTVDVNEMVFE